MRNSGYSTFGVHQGLARSAAPTARPPRLGLAIAATGLGFFLVQLDVSVLDVALARLGAGLATGVTGLQWVVDA